MPMKTNKNVNTEELVKRLRNLISIPVFKEAANALEAQDTRIKSLENTIKLHAGNCMSLSNEIDQMRRNAEDYDIIIATLEAQLKAFMEAAEKEVLPALEFYKNPEVYKPDSIGRIGDLTFRAFPAIRSMMSALQMSRRD